MKTEQWRLRDTMHGRKQIYFRLFASWEQCTLAFFVRQRELVFVCLESCTQRMHNLLRLV
ncbi:unnamed protein product [Ectocarpus sp. 12 AP-2014]